MGWGTRLVYAGLVGLTLAIVLDVRERWWPRPARQLSKWVLLLRLRLYAVSFICILAGAILLLK
jgi:hypothetical protein